MSTTEVRFSNKRSLPLLSLLSIALLTTGGAAQAKKSFFQAPAYDKLIQGAGPETNDVAAKPARAKVTSLAPLTLNSSKELAPENTTSGPLLKSTVTASGFAPKGPVDAAPKFLFGSQSVGDKLSEKGALKTAMGVGLMPLPLMETEDEQQKKVDTIIGQEKSQLADLWESTLTRSPDIQFVIQKLMPTSNPSHASTVMLRMLSTAMFGAMGAINMASPNMGTYAASNAGAQMISNLLGMQESKNAQKAKLSETESIMLYNIVRNTADKLVENYRNYKKTVTLLTKATMDLQDLQNMVADARSSQDAAHQLEMEYTIRKSQRDIDAIAEDMRRFKQSLVDLAGGEAITKLDKQLDEQNPLAPPAPGTPPPQQTATVREAQS